MNGFSHRSRVRVRVEAALSLLFGLLAILTAVWPAWIEGLTGVDPDRGDGTVEWTVVAALGVASVLLALLSYRDRRRLRLAEAT
jgi:hypothetical protein